jgi:hypothetical protein
MKQPVATVSEMDPDIKICDWGLQYADYVYLIAVLDVYHY